MVVGEHLNRSFRRVIDDGEVRDVAAELYVFFVVRPFLRTLLKKVPLDLKEIEREEYFRSDSQIRYDG